MSESHERTTPPSIVNQPSALARPINDRERIMDIIERHFAAENSHDVAATLATYTEDVVWDDVGHPACPVHGKSAVAEIYEGIMDGIPDLHLESVGRFVCDDHVVDESIATGHVRGSFIGIEGGGAPIRFRILHVFDIRDGLISREQAWFDTAGVARQLESHARGAAEPISQ